MAYRHMWGVQGIMLGSRADPCAFLLPVILCPVLHTSLRSPPPAPSPLLPNHPLASLAPRDPLQLSLLPQAPLGTLPEGARPRRRGQMPLGTSPGCAGGARTPLRGSTVARKLPSQRCRGAGPCGGRGWARRRGAPPAPPSAARARSPPDAPLSSKLPPTRECVTGGPRHLALHLTYC